MSMSVHSLPGQASTAYVWQAQSRLTPLLVPVQYSNGDLPTGSTALSTYSPYVMINHTGKHAVSTYKSLLTMSLNQDLSPITQGLRIRVQGAYNRDGTLTETRYAMPELYRAEGRNSKGELITRKIVNERKVTYSHGIQGSRKFHLESTLTYDRSFGSHRTSGLVYYYMSDQQATKDMTSSSLSGIPVRYQGLSSRITYGYRDTYLVDFNFGYTGSENFMPGKQFGFFPSIAGGWVPTQYQWVKEKMSWLSFLKIRGSYGTVGNDRIGGTRFPYLTRMSQGTTAPWGTSVSRESIGVSSVGADNLQWERAIKSNLGIDIEMFDKMLTLTADFFNDQRNGIFQPRVQIPDYVGLITNPYGNVGKMKSWGSDGNISFSHSITKDMSFTLRGNYTFSQNLVQNWEQVNQAHPYLELSGMPHNAVRGYQVAGFYQDEDDIRYSPTQNFGGQLRPGDLKYKDTNGDGKINTNDRVPLSFRQMYPLLMYGFGGEFRYKKFSIGILMKGTGKVDYFRNDWGYIPLHGGETGNILAVFQNPSNRWIPREYAIAQGMDPAVAENPNALVPRLQYGANSNNAQLSDFWKGDARYLRLRDVTISYHMDNDFLKRAGIASVDLQLLGNNLYVWDKVKVFEPEQASSRGEVYPIPMVISFQMFIRL
jgi:TonB-linked SusC/RagA family outer membrane protein